MCCVWLWPLSLTLSLLLVESTGYLATMPAKVSAETKPIIPESLLKKRRTKEAIAAKQAAKNESDKKV